MYILPKIDCTSRQPAQSKGSSWSTHCSFCNPGLYVGGALWCMLSAPVKQDVSKPWF